jgi:hypothetical protein
VSGLRERAENFYGREDHTVRNVMTLAVGIAVGIGAGVLLAPASGEEIRNSIGKKVHDIGDRVRNRFSAEGSGGATRDGGHLGLAVVFTFMLTRRVLCQPRRSTPGGQPSWQMKTRRENLGTIIKTHLPSIVD